VYAQNVDILLQAPGSYRQTSGNPPNWYVSAISGVTPMFGAGAYATAYAQTSSITQLRLAGLFTTQADWLQAYCTYAEPLVNTPTETVAPTPTHFNVVYGGVSTTYPISSWNQVLTINQSFFNGGTLFLQFFQRTSQADLQIAVAGVPIYAANSSGAIL
jgi:hypothetical protein